jgi:hypothetical protein
MIDTLDTKASGSSTPVRPSGAVSVRPSAAVPARWAPLWLDLLDDTARMCAAHGRADLVAWIHRRRVQLLDPQLRILLVGWPGQGRSQLINALLNAAVCPVGEAVRPGAVTVVQYATEPSAAVVRVSPTGTEDRIAVAVRDVARWPSDNAWPGGRSRYVELNLPRSVLAPGLALIDVPALEGPDPVQQVAEAGALTRADTVLFVAEATRELSGAEVRLLERLTRSYPAVLVVQTKIDAATDWRRIIERNQRLLSTAAGSAGVLAVSAKLRLRAARTGDEKLDVESGYPELVAHLGQLVADKGDRLAPAAAALLSRAAVAELAAPLQRELAAQHSGEPTDASSRLHDAQRRIEALRRNTLRWQHALADEVADLGCDLEHDLRERTRTILHKADAMLDRRDPGREWDYLAQWLADCLRDAADANRAWLRKRSAWIALRIAENFPPGVGYVPQWTHEALADRPDLIGRLGQPAVERFSASQRLMCGLRGSYGGVLMSGLATSLAGLPLVNPVSLGTGALFAVKTVYDDNRAVRRRRQATAKAAVQRHVDDAFVRLVKEARDAVRSVQRALRDHFLELTEELQQAIVESARAAQQVADSHVAERDRRTAQIRRELGRLSELYEQTRTPPATGARRGPT